MCVYIYQGRVGYLTTYDNVVVSLVGLLFIERQVLYILRLQLVQNLYT